MKKTGAILILLLIILLGSTVGAFAQSESERITSFHSDITVNPDSTMRITETISIYLAGEQASHGIYRDFPITHTDNRGERYIGSFNLLEVRRDGHKTPYHMEKQGNGVRSSIGDKNILLSSGPHTYTLTYTTSRQLGFFSDHDELYWNVTGNGSSFPIEKASATVTLPAGIRPADIKVEGRTGLKGATEQCYTASVDKNDNAQFSTTRPLAPKEALTIVVSFPKGFVQSPPQSESERITSYHSDITVNPDSTMQVTETISVYCAGEQIRHGIYRDFPTSYKDNRGGRYVVGFNLLTTTRDGQAEPYHLEKKSNGVRIYIGDPNVLLTPGPYTYTLTYTTSHQLGFFSDHDELYWNVTGNGWIFPIEKATATVTLPTGIASADIKVEGYTGPQDAKGQDYTAAVDESGKAQFVTTRPLSSYEGLTIVVSFPKGVVQPPKSLLPPALANRAWLLVIIIALLPLLAYYLWAWVKVGNDPDPGVIMVQYEPPQGLSPAAIRYIRNMGYDNKGLAAGIINLAVKGKVKITQEDDEYTVTGWEDLAQDAALPQEEQYVVKRLLTSDKELKFTQKYSSEIETLNNGFQKVLDKLYGKGELFTFNWGYLSFGLLVAAVLLALIALYSRQPGFVEPFVLEVEGEGNLNMMYVMGVIFFAAGAGVFGLALSFWRNTFVKRAPLKTSLSLAIFLTFFSLPFMGAGLFMSFMVSATYGLFLVGAAALILIFSLLLPAYTVSGRRLLDNIEGFRRYLTAVEQDPLNRLNPPKKTPEIFEKYLPYALALEAEQQWGEQFAEVLQRAGIDSETYSPAWYAGSAFTAGSLGSFSSSFSSGFAGAISSSSTAPSSSSGGGGGGSSGGGGGGGGGGGW